MPGLRLPMHVSYLLYMAGYAPALALRYFEVALALCRASGTQPSLLLHPLDFLGREDNQSLSFFPGMSMARADKLALVGEAIDRLRDQHDVVTMATHADAVLASDIPVTQRVGAALVSQDNPAAL
jgi:peptidoglycan-N-acetylglucosamine deacetylase